MEHPNGNFVPINVAIWCLDTWLNCLVTHRKE